MKRVNNKILLGVLAALVAIFFLNRYFRAPHLEGNLPRAVLHLDTALVNTVRISAPGNENDGLVLKKDQEKWYAEKGSRKVEADENAIKELLGSFAALTPLRLVSRKEDSQGTYNVGDSSVFVSFLDGDKAMGSIHVGKSEFKGSGPQIAGGTFTYVRAGEDKEIYAVMGYLASNFSGGFEHWRNKLFLKCDKSTITKVQFLYPADSSFDIEWKNSRWFVDRKLADSVKVVRYLDNFQLKQLYSFAPDTVHVGAPDIQLKVSGAGGPMITVQAWKRTDDEWILASSEQENTYFTSKSNGVVSDLFVSSRSLLKPK